MTKYRKGPQRTAKDPQRTAKEHYTGPQRIGNHEKTARLATILFNLKKNYFVYFLQFCIFLFFVNLEVLMNYGGLQNDHFETPAQINQSFCFLFCAVGTWSTKTSQFLPSIWILGRCRTVRLPSVDADCCVPCSNAFACQREHSVPDALLLRL